VVDAPPMERLVAVVLKSAAVALVVVKFPPFNARFPEVVILPDAPLIVKLVAVISFAPRDRALTIAGSERSIALVIPPLADCILIPDAKVSLVSRLPIKRSCEGGVGLLPSASDRYVYPPDPARVLSVKFASFKVKAIFLPDEVVIVLPPL